MGGTGAKASMTAGHVAGVAADYRGGRAASAARSMRGTGQGIWVRVIDMAGFAAGGRNPGRSRLSAAERLRQSENQSGFIAGGNRTADAVNREDAEERPPA
jgi:hypothetical protein